MAPATRGELRLDEWAFPDVAGEVAFNLDHERRWTLRLSVTAGPVAIDWNDGSEVEDEELQVQLGCTLAVADWRALAGTTLRLDGDAGNGSILIRGDYEAVWDVTLAFGRVTDGRIAVKLDASACPDWDDGRPHLHLSLDTELRLAGDAAPRAADRSASCPAGRKVCRACGGASFDVSPTCPACGAASWWHE